MDPATSTTETTYESVQAISWKIATQPSLYRQLSSNPYSQKSLQLGLEKFPNSNYADLIWAIVLAEPEGRYDRNFKLLTPQMQEAELYKQANLTSELTNYVSEYYNQHQKEFENLSSELIYEILFKVIFKNSNLDDVEQLYPQNQRKSLKLLILNFVGKPEEHQLPISKKRIKFPQFNQKYLRMSLLVISSISFFYSAYVIVSDPLTQNLIQNLNHSKKIPQSTISTNIYKTNYSFPSRLKIPSIKVDAAVEYVGQTPDGAMDVPSNTIDVGWYKLGPSPGEQGNAVISGHFDGRNGKSGVFNNLDKLKPGDKMYVTNGLGAITTFIVRESRLFKPGYADEVFSALDNSAHLNLITCDGIWDVIKKSYSKRLVVFADLF